MAATDQLDHRATDLQEAANLSDALVQISLNQDATATAIALRDVPPTLLNIPLEIRRSIYQYFLKVDKTANMDINDDPAHLDLTLLHLCRELRSEAIGYLAEKNMWTRLSVFSRRDMNLRDPLWKAPQIPVDLLFQSERNILLSARALSITLGRQPKIKDGVQEKKPKKDILFCYTIPSYVIVCDGLLLAGSQLNLPLSITFAANYAHRNHTIIEDLLLPLGMARDSVSAPVIKIIGLPNWRLDTAITRMVTTDNHSARDYQHHILALKEEGNKLFGKGHPRAAQLYYANALALPPRFLARRESLHWQPTQAEVNVILALHIDVANNYVHCANVHLAVQRDANWGVLPMNSIQQITTAISISTLALSWCGLSNQQRQKGYHRRMVITQSLAEYCTTPGHIMHIRFHPDPSVSGLPVSDPKVLFEVATRECFLSWQADMHSQSAQFLKNLYQKMCQKHSCYLSEDPHLITIRDLPSHEGGVWTGDPFFCEDKTEQQLRLELELSVPRQSKFITEEKLRQMKQDTGIPGDRLDGFIRLLGLEYWRPTSTSTNMQTKD